MAPPIGVLGGAVVYTDGRRVRPREVHNDDSEVAIFLGSGE